MEGLDWLKKVAIGLLPVLLFASPVKADYERKVKVSVNDSTAGYLNGKLVAGDGVEFTENNNGSNETLTIAVTATGNINWDAVASEAIDGAKINWSSVDGMEVQSSGINWSSLVDVINNQAINWDNYTYLEDNGRLSTDALNDLTDIAAALKTGADAKLVTGTAGASGEVVEWDANGDAIGSGVIFGTMTDGKWCKYTSSGTILSCNENEPSGSGTPGGADTEVQYNNAGAFGAMIGVNWDNAANSLGLSNAVEMDMSGVNWVKVKQASDCSGTVGICADTDDDAVYYNGTAVSAGGSVGGSGTTNEIAYWTNSSTIGALAVATYPSLTELSYVKGVSSAIQTQLNAKDAVTTAGRNLTRTTNDYALDVEIYTGVKTIILNDPSTADDALAQLMWPTAVTITRVACSTDTGTATIQFDERTASTPNTGGTDVMTAQLVCDNDEQATTTFDNAGIASRALMSLDVDAVASSPGVVRVHVEFTVDD